MLTEAGQGRNRTGRKFVFFVSSSSCVRVSLSFLSSHCVAFWISFFALEWSFLQKRCCLRLLLLRCLNSCSSCWKVFCWTCFVCWRRGRLSGILLFLRRQSVPLLCRLCLFDMLFSFFGVCYLGLQGLEFELVGGERLVFA